MRDMTLQECKILHVAINSVKAAIDAIEPFSGEISYQDRYAEIAITNEDENFYRSIYELFMTMTDYSLALYSMEEALENDKAPEKEASAAQ